VESPVSTSGGTSNLREIKNEDPAEAPGIHPIYLSTLTAQDDIVAIQRVFRLRGEYTPGGWDRKYEFSILMFPSQLVRSKKKGKTNQAGGLRWDSKY
jgi:hypothetical protein